MKTIYNLTDVGKKAWWLHPLFKPLLALLFVLTMGMNVMAQYNMMGDSFCFDGTTKTTIGMDGCVTGGYYVLLQFKPNGAIVEKTLVVPYTTDPFNFVVGYGTAPGSEGLYLTYKYDQLGYLNLFTSGYSLSAVIAGERQNGQVWIYKHPAVQTLGFLGTEGHEYTISGGVAIYCGGSAGVTLQDSELSPYDNLLHTTPPVLTADEWVVDYQLFQNGTAYGPVVEGTGDAIDWTGIDAAPNTYTATASRGSCAPPVAMINDPLILEINDQARVKNTNTGLCYLTIQEAIDDPLTDDGHTLICLKGETYTEDLTINKGITLMPDPDLVPPFFCDIMGFIDIEADGVTIKNFDGIMSLTSIYAIKVWAPAADYTIDNILLLTSNQGGILIESGAGGGTISNSNFLNMRAGIAVLGTVNGVLTISGNTIEGDGGGGGAAPGLVPNGIVNHGDNVVIDGNTFNYTSTAVANSGDDVTIENNIFWNILYGGTSVLNTGADAEVHGNDFSFGPSPRDVTAINSTVALDGTYNWFGDPTGPSILSNTCGLGSWIIGADVVYSPWYFNEEMTTLNGLPVIALSDIPDMSTITYTPLIISVTATYPNDIGNYDPAVLTDAKITSLAPFVAGQKIISVKYNGTEVLAAPFDLTGTVVYLSDILGHTAPLADHNGAVIGWEFTLAGFDAPWASALSLEAVSYLGDYGSCNNILGTEYFTVSFDDALMAITPTATEVCTTVEDLKFDISITFPPITNVNTTILADARITSDVAIPAGTELTWTYNGVVSGTYLVGADVTSLLLSDIVGMSAPLQGHTGTDVWSFDIVMAIGTYHLTIDALAVLDGAEFVYETDNLTLIVHELPTATLSVVDNQTHICTGTEAHFSVALTGTAPWSITYTDGTTPVTVNDIETSPFTFDVVHTSNLTWTITNVTDAYCSNTGTGSVRIYIGTVTYVGIPSPENPCEGSYVTVPIQVQKFEDVGVVSLTLNYNPAVLQYVDFTNPNPSFPFTLDGDIPGVIKAGGFGTMAFQLADDDTLFNIRFRYLGGPPLFTSMKWDTINPASCEYVSYETNLPFCDVPGKFYYKNLVTDLAGYLRPKAVVSGIDTICHDASTTFKVDLIGVAPWSFDYFDGTDTITVSPINATPAYITVSPGVTTTYTPIAVSDIHGCATIEGDLTGSATVVVNQLPVLTLTPTNVTCFGKDDGKIDLEVTGSSPFTFEWAATSGSFTSTDQNINALYPSTYVVIVTDVNGCKNTADTLITEPNVLNASLDSTDVTCFGSIDGTITVSNPTGGYGAYEVSINIAPDDWFKVTALTPYTFTDLAPGGYIVTIRDSSQVACTIDLPLMTIHNQVVLSIDVAETDVTCNGKGDGTITVTNPAGGHGTYEISIDDENWILWAGVPVVFSGLTPDTYLVQVRDAAYPDCFIEWGEVFITEPDALAGTVDSTNVTCFNAGDGTISITGISGGYGNYEFTVDGGDNWQSDSSFIDLIPGTYDVRMRDADHILCELTLNGALVLNEPEILAAFVAKTDITCFGADDGTITVTNATGGHGSYEYAISPCLGDDPGPVWQSDGSFASITPGSYDVWIRDRDYPGCMIKLAYCLQISEPDAITVSGNVNYYNPSLYTPLATVKVTLKQGLYEQFVFTNGAGYYSFDNVCPGTYQIITTSATVFGPLENPVNITDAALVSQWKVAPFAIERVKFYAGDVVQDDRLASADASRIQQYFLTSGTVGWLGRPAWTFWLTGETIAANPPTTGPIVYPVVTVNPGDPNFTRDLYGLYTGDFNHSWVPSGPLNAPAGNNLRLEAAQALMVEPGVEFELPVTVSSSLEVGAISMLLNFPADKLEITGAYLSGDASTPVMVNLTGDELRIGWMSTTALNINSGDRLITLKLRLLAPLPNNEQVQLTLTGSPLNELADGTVKVISNAVLYASVIKSTTTGIGEITSAKLGFANYPNPFSETTTFVCNLPSDGVATIEVYDMLGKKVNVFLNESMKAGDHKITVNSNTLTPGVYTAILSLNSDGQLLKRTIKLIRNQ